MFRENGDGTVGLANPARIVPVKELLDHAWGQDIQRSPSALEGAITELRSASLFDLGNHLAMLARRDLSSYFASLVGE